MSRDIRTKNKELEQENKNLRSINHLLLKMNELYFGMINVPGVNDSIPSIYTLDEEEVKRFFVDKNVAEAFFKDTDVDFIQESEGVYTITAKDELENEYEIDVIEPIEVGGHTLYDFGVFYFEAKDTKPISHFFKIAGYYDINDIIDFGVTKMNEQLEAKAKLNEAPNQTNAP